MIISRGTSIQYSFDHRQMDKECSNAIVAQTLGHFNLISGRKTDM